MCIGREAMRQKNDKNIIPSAKKKFSPEKEMFTYSSY